VPHLDCDYLIIEGMREAPVPKILCAETTSQLEELFDDTVFAVSGKISSSVNNWHEPPVFNALMDIDRLTRLVMDKAFDLLPLADPECCTACGMSCSEMVAAILRGEKQRSDCHTDHPQGIRLTINGKDIPLVPFVQQSLTAVIKGYVSTLKGGDITAPIKIEID